MYSRQNQNLIIKLVCAGITSASFEINTQKDLTDVTAIATKHSVCALIYSGANICGFKHQNESFKKLFTCAAIEITHTTRLLEEVNAVCSLFSKSGIDHMRLKGSMLCKYYPQSEMRVMGDADILIKETDKDKIAKLMNEQGFEFIYESDHEYTFKKGKSVIEFHKRLIPSYNKDYYAYFGEGFERALPTDLPHEYTLGCEDMFIYIFTHFAKHYRDGGIGIKHLCDLWVYLRAQSNINKAYIENELKKLSLWEFYKNIQATLSVWFEGKEHTEVTSLITDVIISSGAFGTKDATVTAQALRTKTEQGAKNIRFAVFIKKAFPSARVLKNEYSYLEKKPWLLPFAWIYRVFDKKNKISENLSQISSLSDENISEYENNLKAVGLDFKENKK